MRRHFIVMDAQILERKVSLSSSSQQMLMHNTVANAQYSSCSWLSHGKKLYHYGCSNTQEKGVSLFKFPADAKLKKVWTLQVQRTWNKWKGPSKYSAVCSEHFTEDCFELTSVILKTMGIRMKQRLKSNVVPYVPMTRNP